MSTPARTAKPRWRFGDLSQPVGGFVFDIDGTLALLDKKTNVFMPFDGALAMVARLNRLGVPVATFTNGTFQTPEEYHSMLAAAGFALRPDCVFTPSVVAAEHFVKRGIGRVLVLGGESVSKPLSDKGIAIVRPGEEGEKEVNAVLLGWFPEFRLADLQSACEAVWAGAEIFTVSDAPFFAGSEGRILGVSAALAAMIKAITGKRAVVLGKPAPLGLGMACRALGIRPAEAVVVGDDPELEVAMARRSGAIGIGVLTGIGDAAAFAGLPAKRSAHLVLPSIAALLDIGLAPAVAA